ncbi:hypothetical protein [Aestuariivirga sp.]|uniref:hypothetical protein n=1 Tax=Aestuariivirga sp. TaxID=2650926 RepID=UPI0025BD73F5|nr:hypothetical protein [Aestuariivirga sp.]MCA3555980.1 hypothetical protein [Aestuariivirga sp.]
METSAHYRRLRAAFPHPLCFDAATGVFVATSIDTVSLMLRHCRAPGMGHLRLPEGSIRGASVINRLFESALLHNQHPFRIGPIAPAAAEQEEERLVSLLRKHAMGRFDVMNGWLRPAVSRLLFASLFDGMDWTPGVYAGAYQVVNLLDGKFHGTSEIEAGIESLSQALEAFGASLSEPNPLLARFVIFATGHETPANMVANAVVGTDCTLSGNVSHLLLEGLRYDPPIQCLIRRTTEEAVFGEEVIPPGRPVRIHLGLASRDGARYCNPTGFDLGNDRSSAGLYFGAPQAGCPGRHTALDLASVLLTTLQRYIEGHHCVYVDWQFNDDVRAIDHLYIARRGQAT